MNKSTTCMYALSAVAVIILMTMFLTKCNTCSSVSSYKNFDNVSSHSRENECRNHCAKLGDEKCLCSRAKSKLCASREDILSAYKKGNTEYKDFAGIQKEVGGPFWLNTDFSLY